MAKRKMSRKRVSQKENESRQVAKCLRRRLAWCNCTKLPYDTGHEQYSLFRRAMADEEGNPHKAPNSNWTDKLESRYCVSDLPNHADFATGLDSRDHDH